MRPNRDFRKIVDQVMAPLEYRGVVKFFDGAKGYGFIVPVNGGQDIYFHRSVVLDHHLPLQNDEVLFAVGPRQNGKIAATAVRIL
jgi:cold shock protein